MLIVADASPLIVLIHMQHVDNLPQLFGQVLVPPVVSQELSHANGPLAVRDFMARRPSWLVEKAPLVVESIAGLHPGELAAISLAIEIHADYLLIDERRGRNAAAARNIPLTGTVGVLELAAEAHLLNLADAFKKLKKTTFWVADQLLEERLKVFMLRQKKRGTP